MPTRFQRLCKFLEQEPALRSATIPMIELQALCLVSMFVNSFRVQVDEGRNRLMFPSFLGIMQAPSGVGKNAGVRIMMEEVFGLSVRSLKSVWENREVELLKEFLAERRIELEGVEEEKLEKDLEKCRKEFLRKRRVLNAQTATDGSYEGFAFDRAYMEQMGLGAPFVVVEEYGDKIVQMEKNAHVQTLYNKLVELTDNPHLSAKSVKSSEDATPGSDGMGVTCLFTFSAPNEKQREKVLELILKAAGRRGFLVFETLEGLDHDRALGFEELDNTEALEVFEYEIKGLFDALEKQVGGAGVPHRNVKGKAVVGFGEGAKELYREYSKENVKKYHALARNGLDSNKKNQLATLVKDMDRKVLKMAVLLAVFNHGEKKFSVEKEDLVAGLDIVMRSFKNAKAFFDEESRSLVKDVMVFMEGKKEVTAREMWDADLFKGIGGRGCQEPIHDIIMDEVVLVALEKGYELKCWKVKNQDRYSLTKIK